MPSLVTCWCLSRLTRYYFLGRWKYGCIIFRYTYLSSDRICLSLSLSQSGLEFAVFSFIYLILHNLVTSHCYISIYFSSSIRWLHFRSSIVLLLSRLILMIGAWGQHFLFFAANCFSFLFTTSRIYCFFFVCFFFFLQISKQEKISQPDQYFE